MVVVVVGDRAFSTYRGRSARRVCTGGDRSASASIRRSRGALASTWNGTKKNIKFKNWKISIYILKRDLLIKVIV